MPPWLRISIVALLAGLSSGCGSGGLFWVDDKLSKLSSPPTAVASPPGSESKELAANRPSTAAAVAKSPMNPMRDVDDGALVAPPKLSVASRTSAAESEPVAPKQLPGMEAPIPNAFALATPKSVRGDRIPTIDASPKRTNESDLDPFPNPKDRPDTSVTLASLRRTGQSSASETDGSEDMESTRVPEPQRTEIAPPVRKPSVNDSVKPSKETTDKPGIQSAPAMPIPKAATTAPPAKKFALANIALCREILGFGKITGKKTTFRPGGQALVYFEVSGRESKRTTDGVETRLNGRLRLTPKTGGPTLEWPYPNIVDTTPTDPTCYCFMTLELPESLSEGEYRLEVALDDVHGGTSASEVTSLRVERSAASTK